MYTPKKDLRFYHVELYKPRYDPITKKELGEEFITERFIQVYTKREYELLKNNHTALGYKIKVLYEPKQPK